MVENEALCPAGDPRHDLWSGVSSSLPRANLLLEEGYRLQAYAVPYFIGKLKFLVNFQSYSRLVTALY